MGYKIVIPVIAIVAVLFTSGLAIDAFAVHTDAENADKRMVVFKIRGNTGGFTSDSTFSKFNTDNNGVEHFSSWNSYMRDTAHNTYFAFDFVSTCDENNSCQWGQNVDEYANYFDTHGQSKRFMVEGYSFGGGAARFITTDLRNSDVQFDMVWLLDPVGVYSERMTLSSICPDDPFPGRTLVIPIPTPHTSFIDVEEAKEFLGRPLLGAISKIYTENLIRREREHQAWLYSLTIICGAIVVILTQSYVNFFH